MKNKIFNRFLMKSNFFSKSYIMSVWLVIPMVILGPNPMPSEIIPENPILQESEITVELEELIQPIEVINEKEVMTVEEAKKMSEEFIGIKGEIIEEDDSVELNAILTFYTDLECENGAGLGGRNAMSGYLSETSIAAPRNVPFNTLVEFPEQSFGTRKVDDRGGNKIRWVNEDTIRLDVFIERLPKESDGAYYQRVNNMGVVKTPVYLTYPEDKE